MSPQVNVNNPMPNPADATNPTDGSVKQRDRTLRRHESLLFLKPDPSTYPTTDANRGRVTQGSTAKTPADPLEGVARCMDLWFEDGDVVIWACDGDASMLYRVHRRVLKDSGAEPFCTIVDWGYPSQETSEEMFLDGVWVLKYDGQDPDDVMYMLKWMYERP